MNGYLRLRLMRLAKKVRGTVKGEEDQSFFIWSSSESKIACTKRGMSRIERLLVLHLRMEERSSYRKIEEVRMMASQWEEGCFKAIEGNAKEYQIRGMELAVVVLN
ncbi:hypothetical protein Tco_0604583 [Tanacetum coccineum]